MDWEISLDRYLTTPPEDGFDDWAEQVCNLYSDKFYSDNEDWICDQWDKYDDWLYKLFRKGIEPRKASAIIEKAFYLYKINAK